MNEPTAGYGVVDVVASHCPVLAVQELVLVTYEARTAAADDQARRSIQQYWRVLSPFIGLVLRSVLAAIRRRAETNAADPIDANSIWGDRIG